jgi:hypothetical protein
MAIVRSLLRTVLAIGAASSVAVAAQPPEILVKASYLAKFAAFVDWPAKSFAALDSPLHICVTGADPFGPALVDAVKGLQVDGRAIAIDHPEASAIAQCHILFVGTGAEVPLAVQGHPMLTVTDHGQTMPGMIEFMMLEDRVRFAINAAAAERSGLQVSSKLLELAWKVTR